MNALRATCLKPLPVFSIVSIFVNFFVFAHESKSTPCWLAGVHVLDAVGVSPAIMLNIFKAKIQPNGLMCAPLASDVQGTICVHSGRSAENKIHPLVTIKTVHTGQNSK